MMQIEERQSGSVTILTLKGSLISGAGSAVLAEKFAELARRRQLSLLLDCRGVDQIDSEGIGALAKEFTAAQKRGGELKLLRLSPAVQRVLSVLGLLQAFESFADEERAVSSFEKSAMPSTAGPEPASRRLRTKWFALRASL